MEAQQNENAPQTSLARLVSRLHDWVATLHRVGLVRRGEGPDDPSQPVSATSEVKQFRQPTKDIIVWLELRGCEIEAAVVDDAMAALRDVARAYDAGELQPESAARAAEPLTPLDQLIEAAQATVGRLEDLLDELPAAIWQGFDDA
jgi:hypothetical protein